MKIKMCILIAAGLLIGFFSLNSAEPSKRCFGLFVGIEKYQNHGPATYADESANKIYKILKEKKNWDTTRMILLLDSAATKIAIKESIQSIGNRIGSDPDDMFLFYFAGHGNKDYYHHYLMPYDAVPNTNDTWISDEEFRNWIGQYSHANYVVVILDACYSGGMYGGGIVWGLLLCLLNLFLKVVGSMQFCLNLHQHLESLREEWLPFYLPKQMKICIISFPPRGVEMVNFSLSELKCYGIYTT